METRSHTVLALQPVPLSTHVALRPLGKVGRGPQPKCHFPGIRSAKTGKPDKTKSGGGGGKETGLLTTGGNGNGAAAVGTVGGERWRACVVSVCLSVPGDLGTVLSSARLGQCIQSSCVGYADVLARSGCCNKRPQTRWFINNRKFFLPVPEAASLRSSPSAVNGGLWARAPKLYDFGEEFSETK